MKFSTLKQITPANVNKLVRAWTYDTGDTGGGFRGWQVTPLVVNGVMYFSTMGGKLVALNADTGAEIWKFDGKTVSPSGRFAARGISFWPGDAQTPPAVVAATADGFLMQVDAKTGKLAHRFDRVWVVDLRKGVAEKYGNNYSIAAMPAIFKNLAIVIPMTGEQGRYGIPGDPRAFDLHTGEEVWRFHTVPHPGEPGFNTWGAEGWQDRRGPGGWVPMTVDVANGLVFIPLGNATDQNYGGSRPGDDLYAGSIIAARGGNREVEVVFPDDPPRHLRLGCQRTSHSDRSQQGWQEDSRDRTQHETGIDVHLQSADRRAHIRRRGAARPADGCTGRQGLPDAAVSGEARSDRADLHDAGRGQQDFAGNRKELQGAVRQGRKHGSEYSLHDGACSRFSEFRGRRELVGRII